MPELVPVRVRDCACPDSPHPEGDIVFISPTLSLEAGIAAQQDLVAADNDVAELTRRWLVTFVRYGFRGSNFGATLDDLLGDFTLSSAVAEAANDRYSEALLRPLGLTPPEPSNGGRTARSTSATRASRSKSPVSS